MKTIDDTKLIFIYDKILLKENLDGSQNDIILGLLSTIDDNNIDDKFKSFLPPVKTHTFIIRNLVKKCIWSSKDSIHYHGIINENHVIKINAIPTKSLNSSVRFDNTRSNDPNYYDYELTCSEKKPQVAIRSIKITLNQEKNNIISIEPIIENEFINYTPKSTFIPKTIKISSLSGSIIEGIRLK